MNKDKQRSVEKNPEQGLQEKERCEKVRKARKTRIGDNRLIKVCEDKGR